MKIQRAITVTCLFLQIVVPVAVHADTVVLRSGERISGTVANRQSVRTNPTALKQVSLLLAGTESDVRTFPITSIDLIILEDGEGSQVIDIAGLSGQLQPEITTEETEKTSEGESLGRDARFFISLCGAGLIVLGATTQFENRNEPSPINYILVGTGAILFFWGIITSATSGNESQKQILLSKPHPGEYRVYLHYNF
jgi:hypothetical protein